MPLTGRKLLRNAISNLQRQGPPPSGRFGAGAGWPRLPEVLLWGLALLLMPAGFARASDGGLDYLEMPLEELLSLSVTSVSKHAEPAQSAAAAVYVITSDDLRRSGATSVAEALRMVPGLQVARVNAQNWAVSARGFNGLRAEKMQVLVDGHSVYSPLSSTVSWSVLGTHLLDIERIEVIRGPGAALWGANAVNGVVNIVTYSARQTVGTVAQLSAGTLDPPTAALRSGSRWGETGHVRWYAQSSGREPSDRPDGAELDGQRLLQFGFRSDWGQASQTQWTLTGDALKAHHNILGTDGRGDTGTLQGGHLGLRVSPTLPGGSKLHLRADITRGIRDDPNYFSAAITTTDLQFQYNTTFRQQHFSYGGGVRHLRSQGQDDDNLYVLDEHSSGEVDYGFFIQNQFKLGTQGQLTLGSRLDHDHHAGWAVQPNLRASGKLGEHGLVWAALSRAARLPSEVEESVQVLCTPAYARAGLCSTSGDRVEIGQHGLRPNTLDAVEWGLRGWTKHGWSFDLAVFNFRYQDLIALEARQGRFFGEFGNKTSAESYGGELSLRWQPSSRRMVEGFYSYLELDVTPPPLGWGPGECVGCADPRHSAGLRWMQHTSARTTVDGALRYVGALNEADVDAYTELTIRAAWRPRPNLELALIGRDLLHDEHREFAHDTQIPWLPVTDSRRGLRAQLTWEW